MGITDEEGKVELGEKFLGHHGGITWLWLCGVRVLGRLLGALSPFDMAVAFHTVVSMAVGFGANTTLHSKQRWRNAGWLPAWGKEIVDDVLDENSLALRHGK